MPVIAGLTVEWNRSPRLIVIPQNVREVSAQDLIDSLREQETSWDGIDEERLIYEGTGKTALDDQGTKVAITLVLLNAQIYFTPAVTALETGSVTTANSAGKILIDATALFQTNGVVRGDTVYNATTGGLSTVVEVTSETQLECLPLSGGNPNNQWNMSDGYGIWRNEQCSISGGNVVAIDGEITQNFITPILHGPNTQVVRTSSASATLQELEAIQFASYNGGITVNQSTGQAGTAYPIGTPQYPVNNIADAITIGNAIGLHKILVESIVTFSTGEDLTGWELQGFNPSEHHVHTTSGGVLTDCSFKNLHVSGPLYGDSTLDNCRIGSVSQLSGVVTNSFIEQGTITLSAAGSVIMTSCAVAALNSPTIDCNGTGQLIIRDFYGSISVANKTGGAGCSADLSSALIEIQPSCTGSSFFIRGIGGVTNNSAGMSVISAALNSSGFQNIIFSIESLRSTHRGSGTPYYVDPVSGSNNYDGRTISAAVKTVTYAHSLCTDGAGDIIYILSRGNGQIIDENIVITKSRVRLRGSGHSAILRPLSGVPITVNADNVSLSSLVIHAPTGSYSGDIIQVNSNTSLIDSVYVSGSSNSNCDGINIRGGSHHVISNTEIEGCGGYGVKLVDAGLAVGPPRDSAVKGCTIYENGYDGIYVSGSGADVISVEDTRVHSCGGWGVRLASNVEHFYLGQHFEINTCTSGSLSDSGIGTIDSRISKSFDKVRSKTNLIPGLF